MVNATNEIFSTTSKEKAEGLASFLLEYTEYHSPRPLFKTECREVYRAAIGGERVEYVVLTDAQGMFNFGEYSNLTRAFCAGWKSSFKRMIGEMS